MKVDNLPRILWRKGRIINVIKGVDKLIKGAEIKVRQRDSDKMLTLKRPLKYPVPFEIMDADKRRTKNNDVIADILPAEITPARRTWKTAVMDADLLRRLNGIDHDIDE